MIYFTKMLQIGQKEWVFGDSDAKNGLAVPIKYINHFYSTCIGKLNLSCDELISTESVCMFDKQSILLEPNLNGLFTVIAKEYRINHYVFTVLIDGIKLNAEMGLETKLCIGDKCNAKYKFGKEFLVLPEKIKSNF